MSFGSILVTPIDGHLKTLFSFVTLLTWTWRSFSSVHSFHYITCVLIFGYVKNYKCDVQVCISSYMYMYDFI